MPRKPTKTKSASSGSAIKRDPGQDAIDFCELYLRHAKGEWSGQKIVLSDWERDFLRKLFGTLRPDGTRQYRKAFLFIPRKNGKTTLGAAIGLYLLLADKEPGAEIYSIAADRDQAAIMFEIARAMVENEPRLAKRCEVYRRSIVVPSTGSAYHVLSADAPTKHGKNSHGVLFDELHAQPNRDLYDVMKTSMGSRRQPLFLMVTTAGFDRQSVCYEEYQYACKVRDGIIADDTYLPVIYEVAPDADWTDENVWKQANPGLGTSPKLEFLREECARAKESPSYQNTFRRLYLNQWTEQDIRWIDVATWDACDEKFDPADLRGRPCFIGLDLASTTDIAAEALLFPPDEDEQIWRVIWRFFVPADNLRKRVQRDRVPYDVWERQGIVEATPGNIIDYDIIRQRILQDIETYDVREIVYDRWGATQLVTQLQGDGCKCVPFGQGFASMSAPTKELEKLILGRLIAHNGNPAAKWMIGNVTVKGDAAGNLKPDKGKSTEKIDGIVALIMGIGRAQASVSGSIYNKRGLIAI